MAKVINSGYGIQTVLEGNFAQQIAYDSSDRPQYIGVAAPGVLTAEARWSIKKLTYSATNQVTKIEYAGGTNEFDKVWDSRTGYTYAS
jgi:hypothetical protein